MTHTPGRYSVHQKKTLLLPFLYKLAMPDNQFMFSSSSLLRPRFEIRTLAGYSMSVRYVRGHLVGGGYDVVHNRPQRDSFCNNLGESL